MVQNWKFKFTLVLWALLGLLPASALAHVKWFADFSFTDEPQRLSEIFDPTLIGLLFFSAAAIGIAVFIDRRIEQWKPYQQVRDWLMNRRDASGLVIRIGTGMTLLLSFQANSLLQPDLTYDPTGIAWLGWVQFGLFLLLLFPRTVPLAGAGVIGLWVFGAFTNGTFYMLDYLIFLGIGVYLMVYQSKDERIAGLRLPALYFTMGFSLMWLGFEKLVYPQWGLYILEENPVLTMGFPADFFLTGAAFVEISLGFLLIVGLLTRPLGVVVTLVFFSTTLVFGQTEVIGHTILHAALIVFLLEGPGSIYPAPIEVHERTTWRTAFAVVNFLILFGVLIAPYTIGAQRTFEHALRETATAANIETCEAQPEATVELSNGDRVSCDVLLQEMN